MSIISEKVGSKIRYFRKSRGMTIEQLARQIQKSKATMYKYESGQIPMDIDALSDIAQALQVDISYLFDQPLFQPIPAPHIPFFNTSMLYAYYYNGRSKQVVTSLLTFAFKQNDSDTFDTSFYMNVPDIDAFDRAQYIYAGQLSAYDTVSYCMLQNLTLRVEKLIIQIVHPFQTSQYTWGLFQGLSDEPFAPMATKILLSKAPISSEELGEYPLTFTREELKIFKEKNALLLTIR